MNKTELTEMSDLTRYSPVDDCSDMYQDDERGEYVDFFESKEMIDALTTENSRLRDALTDIAAKSDDCYNSELWQIHGIAKDAVSGKESTK